MEFTELVADFAARYGISGLAAEDGTAAIDIDGIIVSLAAVDGMLAMSANIGEPPAEGGDAFANLLLEANLEGTSIFAKSRETGQYVLLRRLDLGTLDAAAFDAALDALVNIAETWRTMLADFRPAAEAAKLADADAPAFGSGGFMQV